jgi:Family of unknown function (DUF6599)
LSRPLTIFALVLALIAPALAALKPGPLLPEVFAGWQRGEAHASTDPSQADPANGPLLKEYGFSDFAGATYTQSGRKLAIKVARFSDASGAYGAFTFYKRGDMQTETIGEQGASENNHVLFYRGNIVVDAVFDHVTAMSAAELRELAKSLPVTAGESNKPPTLPLYLPRQAYIRHSARYVLGPVGLDALGAPLSPQLVDFSKGAEVVLGKYSTSEGVATLTIISYPTPAIAGERLRAIQSGFGSANPPEVNLKRSGPLVALVTGDISSKEAKSLLAAVNYEADVTWNEATSLSKRDNIGNLIVNIFVLVGIVLLFALVLGVMFGGVRVVLKRIFPDRVFDRPEDVEIIRLNLRQ